MPESPAESASWISVIRLGRAHGLRGEIFGDVWNPPESYSWLRRVWIRNRKGEFLFQGEPLEVLQARPARGRLVLRLAGVGSAGAASALTGCEAVVPRGELPPPAEGEHYLSDLLGCAVFDRRSGARVGAVSGWQDFGGSVLLELEQEKCPGEDPVWIPFTPAIFVEIRPEEGRLVVDPPEGLLELNRPERTGARPEDAFSRGDDIPGILPRPVRARRRRPRRGVRPHRDPHP